MCACAFVSCGCCVVWLAGNSIDYRQLRSAADVQMVHWPHDSSAAKVELDSAFALLSDPAGALAMHTVCFHIIRNIETMHD